MLALEYFLEALAHWKDHGHRLTTVALTSCASAAAVMLSLGDRRKASPTLRLILYHFARIHVSESTPITRTHARHFVESLELIDARILSALVSRAANNPPQPVDEFSAQDHNALQERCAPPWATRSGADATAPRGSRSGSRRRTTRRSKTGRHAGPPSIASCAKPTGPSPVASPTVWDSSTSWSSPWPRSAAAPPVPRRSLRVPEWNNAYRDGAVDVAYLKRHTLVLGETGSGKTASAILPVLAAAYRAPEVGVALVIDPKEELGKALECLEENARLR